MATASAVSSEHQEHVLAGQGQQLGPALGEERGPGHGERRLQEVPDEARRRRSRISPAVPSWTTRPACMTATRSPRRKASGTSWVTSTTVLPEPGLQALELVLQPPPGQRVQGSERLVHQQERRVRGEGARQAHPLPLAARELAGRGRTRTGRGRGRTRVNISRARAARRSSGQPSRRGHQRHVLAGP